MDVPVSREGDKILVIGYGNTLRSDDGVGPRVAIDLASRKLPGLTAVAAQQLTPELAESLAAVELAIFVDARWADLGEAVEVRPLEPNDMTRSLGHTSDPRHLLALARLVFGRVPTSWLITVRGVNFSLGEGLTAMAKRAAQDAIERIAELTKHRPRDFG